MRAHRAALCGSYKAGRGGVEMAGIIFVRDNYGGASPL